MILSELVTAAHVAYKGNLRVPAVGTDKFRIYASIANRKQREWATDPYVDWTSLYQEASVGTVTPTSRTYDLDDEVIRAAEYVYLSKDGQLHNVELIHPREANNVYGNAAFISKKTVTFVNDIPTQYAGATLIVPAYYMPEDLVNPNDEVSVDNPDWLVYALAAELARNDYSKDDQFPNLQGMASEIYDRMRSANEELAYLQNSTVPVITENMGI